MDFDYTWLKDSVKAVSDVVKRPTPVVVISTVLPGTVRREILPLCSENTKLCYNPFFIAMGTTMQDFLHPEFVLFGRHDEQAGRIAKEFYGGIHDGLAPVFETSSLGALKLRIRLRPSELTTGLEAGAPGIGTISS